jgi:hypothetical protein
VNVRANVRRWSHGILREEDSPVQDGSRPCQVGNHPNRVKDRLCSRIDAGPLGTWAGRRLVFRSRLAAAELRQVCFPERHDGREKNYRYMEGGGPRRADEAVKSLPDAHDARPEKYHHMEGGRA